MDDGCISGQNRVMGFLRKYFGDPFLGLIALLAIAIVLAIVCSALRQIARQRGYRRFVRSKRRAPKD